MLLTIYSEKLLKKLYLNTVAKKNRLSKKIGLFIYGYLKACTTIMPLPLVGRRAHENSFYKPLLLNTGLLTWAFSKPHLLNDNRKTYTNAIYAYYLTGLESCGFTFA